MKASCHFDQSTITTLLELDPIVQDYRTFFSFLDWSVVDHWEAARSSRTVYTQRTSCERINSQAKELGIERPKVRNGRSVANLNTLIYLVINVRAIEPAKSINAGLLSIQKGIR